MRQRQRELRAQANSRFDWKKLFVRTTQRNELADAITELLFVNPTPADYEKITVNNHKDMICVPTNLMGLLYRYALHADLRAKEVK